MLHKVLKVQNEAPILKPPTPSSAVSHPHIRPLPHSANIRHQKQTTVSGNIDDGSHTSVFVDRRRLQDMLRGCCCVYACMYSCRLLMWHVSVAKMNPDDVCCYDLTYDDWLLPKCACFWKLLAWEVAILVLLHFQTTKTSLSCKGTVKTQRCYIFQENIM